MDSVVGDRAAALGAVTAFSYRRGRRELLSALGASRQQPGLLNSLGKPMSREGISDLRDLCDQMTLADGA